MKFYRQKPIVYEESYKKKYFYIADFYSASKRLVIELDGPIHEYKIVSPSPLGPLSTASGERESGGDRVVVSLEAPLRGTERGWGEAFKRSTNVPCCNKPEY